MKQNVEKALDKAMANLVKLNASVTDILSKQKAAKAEVARLTMIKYGKAYFDFTERLDKNGVTYEDKLVREAFATNNFLLLHELSLKAEGGNNNSTAMLSNVDRSQVPVNYEVGSSGE